MRDDQIPAIPAKPDATTVPSTPAPGAERECKESDALCHDEAYAVIVAAVRKAVERNAVFGS